MRAFPGYVKFPLILISIALVIVAMLLAEVLLLPMMWALLLTLMVLPIATWFERKLKGKALAAIFTITLLMLVVGGLFVLFTSQVVRLSQDSPMIAQKLNLALQDVREFVDQQLGIPFDQQPGMLKDNFSSSAQVALTKLGSTLQNTLTTIGLMVIVPIYMFFFMTNREHFSSFVVMLVDQERQAQAVNTMSKASQIVQKYLVGVGFQVLIVFVLASIVFFALGIKHALFFAVMVAVLNIIPYLGVFIGSSISVVYAYLTTDSLMYPLLVFVLLWVIQLIDNNLIAPYVVGQQIKLNPLAVIVAVILGGLIWGVSGMIIFVPLLGMLKVVLDESESLKPYGYLLGDRKSN